jgi:hypothetical protein
MLKELKDLVFQYARAASFVLDQGAGYRMLTGKAPADTLPILDPDALADNRTVEFDVGKFAVTQTLGQFYDYGVMGVRSVDIALLTGATEWSFAFAFVADSAVSDLFAETLNGESVDAHLCLTTARMALARCILDGGERFYWERGIEIENGLLTLGEVALLAGLDERTVRNAKFVESNLYVPREAALAWLAGKRGFQPTRTGDIASFDALAHGFVSFTDVGDFVQASRKRLELTPKDLVAATKEALSLPELKSFELGVTAPSEATLEAVGRALKVDPKLFALRALEARARDHLAEAQRRVNAALASSR